jgi:hypothetical protein
VATLSLSISHYADGSGPQWLLIREGILQHLAAAHPDRRDQLISNRNSLQPFRRAAGGRGVAEAFDMRFVLKLSQGRSPKSTSRTVTTLGWNVSKATKLQYLSLAALALRTRQTFKRTVAPKVAVYYRAKIAGETLVRVSECPG